MKTEHRAACFRATLDLLGIPLPTWAQRLPSGRKPSISVEAAYRADNPETLHQATTRRHQEHAARLPNNNDPLAAAPIDTAFLG